MPASLSDATVAPRGQCASPNLELAPTRSAAHGYWRAYTTIPETPDLAWLVLGHPDHGVSVYLVRNDDASALYSVIPQKAVTVRHGGYWWDGTNWYRPEVYNPARGTNDAIPVPDAEDLIGQPVEGTPLDIEEINAYPHHHDRINAWLQGRELTVPPRLDLIAEELRADSLLTSAESAERAGIAASTFRAYLARGENDIPAPQHVSPAGGINLWAAPVIDAWVANRSRDARAVVQGVAVDPDQRLSPGIARIQEHARSLIRTHAGSGMSEATVDALASRLVGSPAALEHIIPIRALLLTTVGALVEENAQYPGSFSERYLDMLHWLILHFPEETMPHVRSLILVTQEKAHLAPDRVVAALLASCTPAVPYVREYLLASIEGME